MTERTLALLIPLFLVFSGVEGQNPPQTSVIILVDMSASFAPLTPQDKVALESAAEAALRFSSEETEGWQQPVKFFWSVIGSASMRQQPPCGSAIEFRTIIGPRRPSGTIRSADNLRTWFQACVLRFMGGAVPVQRYTDISGAIALAAEVDRPITGLKVLFVLSDFLEDLPHGDTPSTFVLSGEHVVLLYRPDLRSGQSGDQVFARVQAWERKLRAAGASHVCRLPVQGITAGSIESCLTP